MRDRMEPRNVTLYPDQWATVDKKAEEVGNPGNTSAGLRAIVAAYQRIANRGKDTKGERDEQDGLGNGRASGRDDCGSTDTS